MEFELKKLVKIMTQSKRDALKKQTEKEKEKLAIEVRAFTDEQGKIRAGQVCAVWMKTSIPLILIQTLISWCFSLQNYRPRRRSARRKWQRLKKNMKMPKFCFTSAMLPSSILPEVFTTELRTWCIRKMQFSPSQRCATNTSKVITFHPPCSSYPHASSQLSQRII